VTSLENYWIGFISDFSFKKRDEPQLFIQTIAFETMFVYWYVELVILGSILVIFINSKFITILTFYQRVNEETYAIT